MMPAYLAEKEQWISQFVENALREDVGSGDHTSRACIPPNSRSKAKLLVKEPGILAGVEIAQRIFQAVDDTATFELLKEDGAEVFSGDIAFYVEANTRNLLKAERLILNTMQRMSGIASLSNRYKFEVEDLPVTILDTRKTTPLIRFIEKWAVHLGGCTNYRYGLYDWVMIKDNHVEACGGVKKAINQVEAYQKESGLDLSVTVEVRNLIELYEALEAEGRVTRIMLDNFFRKQLCEAVKTARGRAELEASGNVTDETLVSIAETGIDLISIGALTKHVRALDFSMRLD